MYRVIGYSGDPNPTTIFECGDLTNAVQWAQMYVSKGDWGGYDELHVKNPSGVTEVMMVREEE